MILKCKVSDEGEAYVALIDPETKEHKKTATIAPGSEVSITLDDVDSPNGVQFGEVLETNTEPADQGGTPVGEGAGTSDEDVPVTDGELPAGLGIGRIVIYRSKTGSYDLPAIVNCTFDTLDPVGVEQGHVPALSDPEHVHLTVFTCGKQGTAREGNEVNNEAAGGSYQEFDIPVFTSDGEPSPGTWRWPERV